MKGNWEWNITYLLLVWFHGAVERKSWKENLATEFCSWGLGAVGD